MANLRVLWIAKGDRVFKTGLKTCRSVTHFCTLLKQQKIMTKHRMQKGEGFFFLNFISHHRKTNFEKLLSVLYLQIFGGIKCYLSELVILSFYGLLQCSPRASLLSLFFKVDIEIKWDQPVVYALMIY